jgi:ferric-dicitrate binding protein FerR (iron transport regulator)
MQDSNDSERDPVSTLLAISGTRELPSAAATERARKAALAVWREDVVSASIGQRPWRTWLPLAAAALLIIAVAGVTLWPVERPLGPETVAVVAVLDGAVEATAAGVAVAVTTGSSIQSGSILQTRAGRIALALGDRLSVRLDNGTRLRLDGRGSVTLLEGVLYVDSGAGSPGEPLRVAMPLGFVEHVGTQYEVTAGNGAARLRVREGVVKATLEEAGGGSVERIEAGEALSIDASGFIERRPIRTFGPDWDWVSAIAPAFAIEGRSLHDYLTWLCREQGWTLRWARSGEELAARRAVLHGSIAGLSVQESMTVVSAITQATLNVRDGALSVDLASKAHTAP